MISDDWFSDFLKSDRIWDLLPIDIYYGALFTVWVWHGFGIHRSLLLFLWFYCQLLFRWLNRLWFDCLFTNCSDQSISSKEDVTIIIILIYQYSIWLLVNLLVYMLISEMHDLQVFFSHTLLSLLSYSSAYDY